MPYFVADAVKDTALTYIKNNVTKVVLTVGEPTSYANANTNNGTGSGQKCAEVTVDSTDLILGEGPTDGRKVECAAQNTVPVVANGTVDHWAWLDVTGTAIVAYGPLSPTLAVTTSGTVNIPAHSHIYRDATAIV